MIFIYDLRTQAHPENPLTIPELLYQAGTPFPLSGKGRATGYVVVLLMSNIWEVQILYLVISYRPDRTDPLLLSNQLRHDDRSSLNRYEF